MASDRRELEHELCKHGRHDHHDDRHRDAEYDRPPEPREVGRRVGEGRLRVHENEASNEREAAEVITIGEIGTFQRDPVAHPTNPDTAMATTNASGTGMSDASDAATTAARAKFDPIERSMLPVMTRIAVPTAAMAVTAMLRPITRAFEDVKKCSFFEETSTTQPPIAISSPRFLLLPRTRLAKRDGSETAVTASVI